MNRFKYFSCKTPIEIKKIYESILKMLPLPKCRSRQVPSSLVYTLSRDPGRTGSGERGQVTSLPPDATVNLLPNACRNVLVRRRR
jgi:hypothetical protein